MRIFLDANILFSAAKSDGAIRRLLSLLDKAGHKCWVDYYVLEEARRNLLLKYPKEAASLDKLLGKMSIVPTVTREVDMPGLMRIPEKDRPVLAAAIRHGCDALFTGDRSYFGALFGTTIEGVAIHSPRTLAEVCL